MNLAALSMLTMSLGFAEPSANDVIPTNSRVHKLQIDYKPEQRKLIQRVELCVSRDQGGVWTVADAVTPDKDHLLLNATTDGHYWVKMVIVFRDGTREPSDVLRMQPDFKMLVDATAPVVAVKANRQGEEIQVDWTIEEKYPNDSATQVVYRSLGPEGGDWQPVPPGSISKRSAKFKPGTNSPVVVQVVAVDTVGNQGVGAKEVAGVSVTAAYPTIPTANPATVARAFEPPISGPGPVVPGTVVSPPVNAVIPAGTGPSLPNTPLPPPNLDPVTPSPAPAVGSPAGPVAPAPLQPNLPPEPQPQPAAPAPTTPVPAPVMSPTAPTAAPLPPPAQQLPVMPAGAATAATTNTPAPLPVTDANAPGLGGSWTSSSSPVERAEPPAPTMQTINYLRFDLQYQIDNGPSGISRVDLYVTRDQGRNWVKWSEHDGKQQPLKVQLDSSFNQQREGEYGFRLVPVSGAGLSDGAPAPGTMPELRVNVDLTPPLIRPFMPTANPNQRNTLMLLWEATDKNFGHNPIAIDWSETPNGPWKSVNPPEVNPQLAGATMLPVAGQNHPVATTSERLPNTGSFAWQLPSNMTTHKVYLKFTVWDAAGNKSEVITQSPVMVDLVKPKARIQGISTPMLPSRP